MDGCSAADVDAAERFVFFQLHLSLSFFFFSSSSSSFTLRWVVQRPESGFFFKKNCALLINSKCSNRRSRRMYLHPSIHNG